MIFLYITPNKNQFSGMTLEQIHETVPGLRQMMYGKDKARYAPTSLSKAIRRERIIHELNRLTLTLSDYRKFTRDIVHYDWKQPQTMETLSIIQHLDLEDIKDSLLLDAGFYCYDDSIRIHQKLYSLYIINFRGQNYLMIYNFGRYFNSLKYPHTKLHLCIPFRD